MRAVPEDNHLILTTVRIDPGTAWVCAARSWQFLLICEGFGEFVSTAGKKRVGAGDVLVMHDRTSATVLADKSKPLVVFHFRFSPDSIVGLLTMTERLALDGLANQTQGGRLFSSGTTFAQQFRDLSQKATGSGNLVHRCMVLQLVASFLSNTPTNHNPAPAQPDTTPQARIHEVIGHLTESEFQTLSVEDLARKCGCGRRQLNRLLKKQYGCSFMSLKTEIRLQKAAALLRSTDDKIINVAMDCGFNNLGLFSARFKRRFGSSPGEWRRRLLELNGSKDRTAERSRSVNPTIRLEWTEESTGRSAYV